MSPSRSSSSHQSHRTTDHDAIRHWAEQRDGHPAVVRATADSEDGGGILRIDFGKPEEALEEISWDEFFEIFDDRHLAFVYQDKTAGRKTSRFFKFVSRDSDGSDGDDNT
jgi:hypothetical protein